MKNTLNNAFIFAIGAAVGSVVTWKLLKTKYERIAKEEIESVKEVFSHRRGSSENHEETDCDDISDPDDVEFREYASTITGQGYAKEVSDVERPYVIRPDEYGEMYDYDNISLVYYADGVLAYEDDEIVEDVDDIVGEDFASHFGEYEDDSVFVRNDRMRVDYEILKDERTFSDVVNSSPHLTEDE